MEDESKFIRLNTEISNLKGKSLEKRIYNFLISTQKVICKALNKRPVFVDKYLSFVDSRNDKNHRKRSFFSGIELIKKVRKENIMNQKNKGRKISYEFKGITPKGNIVGVHISEFSTKRDKKLKLVSTFWY